MHRLLIFPFISLFYLGTPVAQAETLAQMQEEAMASNPGVLAARDAWMAAQAQESVQGWWPNPQLKLSFENLPSGEWDFTRSPMSGKKLMLMQKVPFWKAPLRGRMAQTVAKEKEAAWQVKRWELRQQVAEGYHQILYLQEAERILTQNHNLLQRLAKIARVKYEGGRGLEQDVLRAELEEALMQNQLLEVNQNRQSQMKILAALLGREPDAAVHIEGRAGWQPRLLDRETLIQEVRQNNPELKRMQKQWEKSRWQQRLENEAWIPELELSGYYTWREPAAGDMIGGEDFAGAAAGIEIPLYFFAREIPRARAAGSLQEQMHKQLQDAQKTTMSRVLVALDTLERLVESEDLYRKKILPQARSALDSSMAAYQTGRVEFNTMVGNEILFIRHELQYQKIIETYEREIARLETLLGRKLAETVKEAEK